MIPLAQNADAFRALSRGPATVAGVTECGGGGLVTRHGSVFGEKKLPRAQDVSRAPFAIVVWWCGSNVVTEYTVSTKKMKIYI